MKERKCIDCVFHCVYRFYSAEIVLALLFLHNRGIIYRLVVGGTKCVRAVWSELLYILLVHTPTMLCMGVGFHISHNGCFIQAHTRSV